MANRVGKLKFVLLNSEVSLARFVAAITIELDGVASAFTGRTAVFSVRRLRTRTRRVLALFLFSHNFLLALYEK